MAFAPGDEIVWWDDGHGRGVDPDAPTARRCTGIVDAVLYSPAEQTRIVAYSVLRSNTMGRYLTTIRKDLGHRPELAERNESDHVGPNREDTEHGRA
ncbi:hypothetical protein [Nocardia mangyaensis]|uniref:hypothetical protein n=1 Tax=Nocardia mangyaensis TaxID=2213200 RepID=UPI002675BE89|nr:hypothetical protein [Nocardia mangyaensis]MDO3651164.1 hypothetical protein [Nocardia mangyaensis]